MLLSNVILDGFTLVATVAILSQAVVRPGLLRIPMAVFLDIVVAALLACCSLYFGLMLTSKALSVSEVLNVLLAKSPDGYSLELGPYFWAMHTTFLPTLLYLGLIFAAWLGKALLTPVEWFFGKGQESSNPLKLTSALCGVFMAVFWLLSYATAFMEKFLKTSGS